MCGAAKAEAGCVDRSATAAVKLTVMAGEVPDVQISQCVQELVASGESKDTVWQHSCR